MALTEDDKKEILEMIEHERTVARMRASANREKELRERETKLYLITLTGHQIAFPDERGRAVLNHCFYGHVEVEKGGTPHFYGGKVEVVAFGDGQALDAPVAVVLSGSVSAFVEVSQEFFDSIQLRKTATARAES